VQPGALVRLQVGWPALPPDGGEEEADALDQIGGAKFTEPSLPVVEIRSPATPAKRMVSLMACALP
jgi:hypothetical protein